MDYNKASDYAGMSFEAIAKILSDRVEQAKGFLSYGMYDKYSRGYFKYYHSERLKSETIPPAWDEFKTGDPSEANVRIFARDELQSFLDLLQHDEGLLKLTS